MRGEGRNAIRLTARLPHLHGFEACKWDFTEANIANVKWWIIGPEGRYDKPG